MGGLRFYALFISISVISGRRLGDSERLCSGTSCIVGKISASSVATARSVGQRLTWGVVGWYKSPWSTFSAEASYLFG